MAVKISLFFGCQMGETRRDVGFCIEEIQFFSVENQCFSSGKIGSAIVMFIVGQWQDEFPHCPLQSSSFLSSCE